jgi:hypothetical protein
VSRRPTWTDHEAWLAGFLEPLSADELRSPLAMCFTGEHADWLVDCRPERHDDEADPVTELAVVVAELAPEAAVVATPTRMRDLDTPDSPVVARVWTLTSIVRRPDGGGYDLQVRTLPAGGVGSASDMDVEMGPVASVLDDAVRHRLGESPQHALYTAASWRHDLYAGGISDVDLDAASRTAGAEPGRSDVRGAEAARHRLGRHARDLAARHQPTAGWPQPLLRPAVHASTPDGWQAACPI